jgi:hypothetical protein
MTQSKVGGEQAVQISKKENRAKYKNSFFMTCPFCIIYNLNPMQI